MDTLDTNVDKFNFMVNMQDAYHNAIVNKKHINDLCDTKIQLAILDEVGELNHELKKLWCWWKDSQQDVDVSKVLEELIDVWNLVIIRYLLIHPDKAIDTCLIDAISAYTCKKINLDKINYYFKEVVTLDGIGSLHAVICLSEYLGFTFDQIFECYQYKNNINWNRLNSGY